MSLPSAVQAMAYAVAIASHEGSIAEDFDRARTWVAIAAELRAGEQWNWLASLPPQTVAEAPEPDAVEKIISRGPVMAVNEAHAEAIRKAYPDADVRIYGGERTIDRVEREIPEAPTAIFDRIGEELDSTQALRVPSEVRSDT